MVDNESSQDPPFTTTGWSAPYPQSWVNRLSATVDRLPGPSGLYYLGVWLILVLTQAVILYFEVADPLDTFQPVQVFMPGTIAYMLAVFSLFRHRADAALKTIMPVLTADDDQVLDLHYRLTTLPRRGTVLAGLGMLSVLFCIDLVGAPYWLETRNVAPVSALALRIIYIVSWWIFGSLVYHTIHNLRLINVIYSQFTRVNLFRTKPLHALSNLMALSAISLTVMPLGFLVSIEATDLASLDQITIAVVLVIQATAALTFIWPQLGIHRLQKAQKDAFLDEVNQRYEKVIQEIHHRIDHGEMESVDRLNSTLTVLEMEIKSLRKIPEWPWDPEAMRWLITALVLPIGIMILQLILQRLLGT